jgi:hypothetical protein
MYMIDRRLRTARTVVDQTADHAARWAPSFSVGTAGHVSAPTIRRCIERAEHVGTRR